MTAGAEEGFVFSNGNMEAALPVSFCEHCQLDLRLLCPMAVELHLESCRTIKGMILLQTECEDGLNRSFESQFSKFLTICFFDCRIKP